MEEELPLVDWYIEVVQMPIMTSPWKHPETGVYYFRRAVPADLRESVGRSSLKKSLGTKDPNEAKRLIVPHIVESDELFHMARLRLSKGPDSSLTPKDAAIIASRWYERMVREIDDKAGDVGLVKKVVNGNGSVSFEEASLGLTIDGSNIHRASRNELDRLASQLAEFIDEQLREEVLTVPKDSDQYRWLAKEFFGYLYSLEGLCKARLLSDWSYMPPKSIADSKLSVEAGSGASIGRKKDSGKGIVLSQLLKDYRASQDVQHAGNLSRMKTLDSYESSFKRLIDIIGDVPVDGLKAADLMRFRDTLLQMPKKKLPEIRSLSVEQQIEYAKKYDLECISPATVKNNLKHITTILSYAVEAEHIDYNPAMKVKKPSSKQVVDADELQRGYTKDELAKIFSHPIFNDPKAHKRHGWASYWIPLICRYTGARLNEVGQLLTADIMQKDGVWCFNFRRGEGQSLKNNSSVRYVPIHHHLIDLGFLEYVQGTTTQRLFDKVPNTNKYGKTTSVLSTWWGNIVRGQGVDPKAPAHEFRHTIKSELRELGVPDSTSDRITGHGPANEGAGYGGVGMAARKETIDRVGSLGISSIYKG